MLKGDFNYKDVGNVIITVAAVAATISGTGFLAVGLISIGWGIAKLF